MIIFDLESDTTVSCDRVVYFLGTTEVVGKDRPHTSEIYEQLDAELAFNI